LFREFDTVEECASFFGKTKAIIYNRCSSSNRFFPEMGVNVNFTSQRAKQKVEQGEKIDKRFSSIDEAKLRKTETEDQTRRRLGLNPYGDWRNDEWIYAMMERVNQRLYPDGYDEHAAWLSMREKDRTQKGRTKRRLDTEDIIDEEFEQYIK
jgi:hypothetical protein